jgi:hypothetical protein
MESTYSGTESGSMSMYLDDLSEDREYADLKGFHAALGREGGPVSRQ